MEAHTEADVLTFGNSIAGNKGHPPGRVISIMAYTERIRPKGVPLSGFRYMKG